MAAAAAVTSAAGIARSERFTAANPLKRGEFVWEPQRSTSGPVVLIVSIPEQMVHVYRGGVEIGVSTCSTGKPGHRTPTGVFTILEKQREHVSSIYKGAQMPNMERLTWGGIALHAGNLPGYPASHGCIRLPLKFSALLYEVTHLGVAVIIADERTQPQSVVHPGLMLSSVAESETRALVQRLAQKRSPGGWETAVQYPLCSIVVSRADGMAYVTKDGAVIATYPAKIAQSAKPLGTHLYSLVGPAADGSGLLWLSFGLGKAPKEGHIVNWRGDSSLRRISFYDMKRAREIAEAFHPGTMLMVTDATAPRTTRSTDKQFAVVASDHET
ncbi:MAG: L,D-transpeptidase [Hyphomicrobiaceae bacterium]|nr:L,D-transpeptidase [Hyphomicrobiaceae bacterium]